MRASVRLADRPPDLKPFRISPRSFGTSAPVSSCSPGTKGRPPLTKIQTPTTNSNGRYGRYTANESSWPARAEAVPIRASGTAARPQRDRARVSGRTKEATQAVALGHFLNGCPGAPTGTMITITPGRDWNDYAHPSFPRLSNLNINQSSLKESAEVPGHYPSGSLKVRLDAYTKTACHQRKSRSEERPSLWQNQNRGPITER